jgi:hypothetical protein
MQNKELHPTAGNAPVWIRASLPAVDELDVSNKWKRILNSQFYWAL